METSGLVQSLQAGCERTEWCQNSRLGPGPQQLKLELQESEMGKVRGKRGLIERRPFLEQGSYAGTIWRSSLGRVFWPQVSAAELSPS